MGGQGGRGYFDRITINPPPDSEQEIDSSPSTVNFYAFPSDPNGLLSGDVGDRVWQINSENKWVCQGDTVWALDDGGGVAAGRTQFLWEPGATSDPDLGLYGTWAEVYEAAAEVAAVNLDVEIILGVAEGDFEIDTGEWDMDRIALIGYPAYEATGLISLTVDTSEGTVFNNFTRGISYLTLNHVGSDPLMEMTADTTYVNLGENSIWRTEDAPVFSCNGGSAVFTMGNNVTIGSVEDGTIVVNVEAGSAAAFNGGANGTFTEDCLGGAGQFDIDQGTGSTTIAQQTTISGVFGIVPADELPVEAAVILRPAAPNPGAGIFGTWAQAHAAAIATGKVCTIYVDNPGGPGVALVIPSATYNMANIRLAGFTDARFGAAPNDVPTHFMITSAATVFTNFVRGMSNVGLVHNGDTALCTLTLGATALWVSTGDNGYYAVDTGNTGSIWQTAGTGSVTFQVGLRTIWQNSGTGYEILNLGSAGSSVVLQVNAPRFSADSIRGVASATLSIVPLSTFVYETQANLTTAATITSTAASLTYTPSTSSDWTGSDPTTIQDAIDRIAATAGPIA